MSSIFIFGIGYCSLFLAKQLQQLGWKIAGTVRNADKAQLLRNQGFDVYLYNRRSPDDNISLKLSQCPYILNSIPPDEDGDPVYDQFCSDILRLAEGLNWFGYLSTTGVYGNHNGQRVDENSLCIPTSIRASKRLEIEKQWLQLALDHNTPTHIFRLSGIYGPDRNALIDLKMGQARPIHKPGHLFNRIHVDDIVNVLIASMKKPSNGNVYNLADDHPSSSADVICYGAKLLGLEQPFVIPHEQAQLSQMAKSFYNDNKIVDNTKIKTTLGIQLKYPDFYRGLESLLQREQCDFTRI